MGGSAGPAMAATVMAATAMAATAGAAATAVGARATAAPSPGRAGNTTKRRAHGKQEPRSPVDRLVFCRFSLFTLCYESNLSWPLDVKKQGSRE